MSSGPYFNTELYCRVALYPNQLDNDIYKNLKNNLIKKYQGKCYKSYGLITKIHKISERSEGKLIPEDFSSSVYYNVKFSCRLCRPLKNSFIVAEVIGISQAIVYLRNGDIQIYVLDIKHGVNPNNFVYDERTSALIANIGNNRGKPVEAGDFLKVKVDGVRLEHGESNIVVMGILESLASSKESNDSILQQDNANEDMTPYEDYMAQENDLEQTSENNSDSTESEEKKPKKKKSN